MYEKMQRANTQEIIGDRGCSPPLLMALIVTQKLEHPLEGLMEEYQIQQVC
jgi:hypothetical protein